VAFRCTDLVACGTDRCRDVHLDAWDDLVSEGVFVVNSSIKQSVTLEKDMT
jgi:hypothetical protein